MTELSLELERTKLNYADSSSKLKIVESSLKEREKSIQLLKAEKKKHVEEALVVR